MESANHDEALKEIRRRVEAGDVLSALVLTKRYLEREPDNPRLLFQRGLLEIKLGLYTEAYQTLKRLVEAEPWNLDAIYNLAFCASKLGRNGEAIAYYRTYLRKREDPEAYNNLGIALDREGRIEEALEAYSKAIELSPDNLNALINRGNLYLHLRQYEEALRDLRRAEELNPDHFLVNYSLGILYFLKREYDQSKRYLEQAARRNPFYSDTFYTLGDISHLTGDYESALSYYRRALEMNPSDSQALEKLLEVCEMGELWEELAEITDRLSKEGKLSNLTEPILTPRLRDKVKLYRAIALLRLGEVEEALKSLRELSNSVLKDRDIRLRALREMIELDEAAGDLQGMLAHIGEAQRLNPSDPELAIAKARALRKLGDYQGAYTEVLRALRLNPQLEGKLSTLVEELRRRINSQAE